MVAKSCTLAHYLKDFNQGAGSRNPPQDVTSATLTTRFLPPCGASKQRCRNSSRIRVPSALVTRKCFRSTSFGPLGGQSRGNNRGWGATLRKNLKRFILRSCILSILICDSTSLPSEIHLLKDVSHVCGSNLGTNRLAKLVILNDGVVHRAVSC